MNGAFHSVILPADSQSLVFYRRNLQRTKIRSDSHHSRYRYSLVSRQNIQSSYGLILPVPSGGIIRKCWCYIPTIFKQTKLQTLTLQVPFRLRFYLS